MRRQLQSWGAIALITLAYIVAGKVGLSIAHIVSVHGSVSPIWPPTGLALAAILVRGQRMWPAIFVGAFIVNATQPQDRATAVAEWIWILQSLVIALGNTLEALTGAWLVERFARGKDAFQRGADVMRYFVLTIPSTAISATMGTMILCLTKSAHWDDLQRLWTTWWTGDYVSDLLVAPLLIMLASWQAPQIRGFRVLEALGIALATISTIALTFSARRGSPSMAGNLLLPLMLVAGFRFQQWGAILSAAIMSAGAAIGTLYGRGPYAVESQNSSLLLLQAFVAFRAVTALVLGAVVSEGMRDRQAKEVALEAERKARADAERANRAKDEFLAVLSHELRTPLTPVMLTATLLENDMAVPDKVRADLKMIRENTALEARLIDDLLDLSRITRGKLTLQLESVNVHDIVRRAVDICCSTRMGDISQELDATRPYVFGDSARLHQVFWNLLNNAMKFTPLGRGIRVRSYHPDAMTLRMEISDAGIGIDPGLVPRMFEAFEQGDARSTGNGGLGLGLTITRALVEAHGGRISAFSQGRDKGTTFIVDFAVHVPAQTEPAEAPRRLEPRGNGLRVLLVEDHEGTRQAMIRLLRALGHAVTAAGSMKEALTAAEGTFDLVISDIGLPDATGLDLIRALRELFTQRGENVRAIAVSGYGMEHDIRASLAAGFDAHLTKPVSPDRLAQAIDEAIKASEIAEPMKAAGT